MSLKMQVNLISPSLQKIARDISKLPEEAHDYWVSITPIKTGNARRRTSLQGQTINADYNYAVPLDKGHSKQAPNGMSKPTEKFIEKKLKSKIRK